MKNKIIYIFKSKLKLKITGKNISRFIKKIMDEKIDLLNIDYVNRNEVNIIIYKKDYDKLTKIKSIYDFNIINSYGIIKIKKRLNIHKYLIISIIIGYFLLVFLNNIIFEIEIIHNDPNLRNLLKKELYNYGISEKKFKKNFKQIEIVKEEILNKYKDKIEWLEIINEGTKYIVRVEERQIPNNNKDTTLTHIIAKKDGIIKRVDATSGEIIRDVNDYVKKGDIIITGNLMLNDEIKQTIKASGQVFAEVWYNVSVEYPFTYFEEKKVGKKKNVLVLNFLNKKMEFAFNKFKQKESKESNIIKHPFLPISLTLEHQEKIEVVDSVYTVDEAISKSIEKAKKQITDNLKEKEYIIDFKTLKEVVKEDRVIVDVFFTVYEDITDFAEIVLE